MSSFHPQSLSLLISKMGQLPPTSQACFKVDIIHLFPEIARESLRLRMEGFLTSLKLYPWQALLLNFPSKLPGKCMQMAVANLPERAEKSDSS